MKRSGVAGIFLMIQLSLCAIFFCSREGRAQESQKEQIASQEFHFASYEEALKAKEGIKFQMESTKAGLFTTSFAGVVKHFRLFTASGSTVLVFKVQDMDTDSEARNEKMRTYCFDFLKFPDIILRFPNLLPQQLLAGQSPIITTTAKLQVRGKSHDIVVKLQAQAQGPENQGKILVQGTSSVLLSALQIPNPSIWVASVRDRVDINFSVLLSSDN